MPRSGYPRKFSSRAGNKMLEEIADNPKTLSWYLEVLVPRLCYVELHASTIRKRLYKFNLYRLCARKKCLL